MKFLSSRRIKRLAWALAKFARASGSVHKRLLYLSPAQLEHRSILQLALKGTWVTGISTAEPWMSPSWVDGKCWRVLDSRFEVSLHYLKFLRLRIKMSQNLADLNTYCKSVSSNEPSTLAALS